MPNPSYLKKIEIIGIYDRFDIIQEFSPGVNIIHGANGSGKTTLIHVLTNILNGDYHRFLYIQFFRIRVWFDNDNFITIYNKVDEDQGQAIRVCVNYDRRGIRINKQVNEFEEFKIELTDYTQEKVVLPAAYFPAFRTMIEAWKSIEENTNIEKTTSFSRKVFGDFYQK